MKRRDIPVARLHELFRYDPDTGKFYKIASGRAGFVSGVEVGFRNDDRGYMYLNVDRLKVACHRAAWAMTHGEWPIVDIDHEDRDQGNNRIKNLRLATDSQNQANTAQRPSQTGRRGVRWCKGKPQAQIKHGGKVHHLGTFATVDEAAAAYNAAAIRLHGEFAVLNPIGEVGQDGAA